MKPRRVWADLLIGSGLILLLAAGVLATEPKAAPARLATATRRPTIVQGAAWAIFTPVPTEAAAVNPTALSGGQTSTLTAIPRPTLSPTRAVVTVLPTATRLTSAAIPAPPRLEIPKIGLSVGISEVIWRVVETNDGPLGIWDTVETGMAHHSDSARPGARGNVVLSGHSRGQGSLAQLSELVAGDQIMLAAEDGRSYIYRVIETLTLPEVGATLAERRAHAQYMSPTADARLTLITCWPPWAYTHRLIVIARLEG